MRKITIILSCAVVLSSCSVFRRTGNEAIESKRITSTGNILQQVVEQNIASKGFFIQKAEIEFDNGNGSEKYLASVKFEYPDKYLISVKSRTGIEGARIFIAKDSVFVNDRINKKLYIGTSLYLNRKYGLNKTLLPLIFGDLVLDKDPKMYTEICTDNRLIFECNLKGAKITYQVNCIKDKLSDTELFNDYSRESIKIKYNNYFRSGNIIVPKNVEFSNLQISTRIKMKIIKLVYPYSETVKFVPGKGYELIELL